MRKLLWSTVSLGVTLTSMPDAQHAGALSGLSKAAADFINEHVLPHLANEGARDGGPAVERYIQNYIRCEQNPASCGGLDPAAIAQFKKLSASEVKAMQHAFATFRNEPTPPIAPDQPLTVR